MEKYRWKVKEFKYESMKCNRQYVNNLSMCMLFAQKHGWDCTAFYEHSLNVIFKRKKQQMNVYLSTMTIQTVVNHPKHGRTQLNRKGLSFNEVEFLFMNPRSHTGKGYYTKIKTHGK